MKTRQQVGRLSSSSSSELLLVFSKALFNTVSTTTEWRGGLTPVAVEIKFFSFHRCGQQLSLSLFLSFSRENQERPLLKVHQKYHFDKCPLVREKLKEPCDILHWYDDNSTTDKWTTAPFCKKTDNWKNCKF